MAKGKITIAGQGSRRRPEPRVVVSGGHDRGRGAVVEQEGRNQMNPHSDVEVMVRSESSREEGDVDRETDGVDLDPPSSSSTLWTSYGGTPDSTWRRLIQLLPLIVCLDNTNASIVPGHVHEALSPNQSEPNTANENKSNWKSTVSTTAKFFLLGARDSADVIGPLKSVAASL